METQKQIVDSLKKAKNVLVTVSNNPSVDQLAACIGLSLMLTKLDAHAAAVYSGATPSTIEFLNPDETFEKTTDSLRDFIISLDKSKADKLRYKVEDDVVRIFITPYRTSISDQDLNFSQGDFNVDVVVALGVHEQGDLDQAITTHGRILHDATVITVNNKQNAEIGAINWLDQTASSLCEMVARVAHDLKKDGLDEQIATALLTGVVAETERFSNEKTSAETMKVSAMLMAAGANQQLVATKLDAPVEETTYSLPEGTSDSSQDSVPEAAINDDGTLEISHGATDSNDQNQTDQQQNVSEPNDSAESGDYPKISPSRAIGGAAEPNGLLSDNDKAAEDMPMDSPSVSPPINSFSAGREEESFVSPMSLPPVEGEQPRIMKHDDKPQEKPPMPTLDESEQLAPYAPEVISPTPQSVPAQQLQEAPVPLQVNQTPDPALQSSAPSQPSQFQPRSDETLAELEKEVGSSHTAQQNTENTPESTSHDELNLNDLEHPDGSGRPAASQTEDVDAARDAVAQAMASMNQDQRLEPIQALNAQPLGEPLHETAPNATPAPEQQTPLVQSSEPAPQTAEQPVTMPLPSSPPPIIPLTTNDQQPSQPGQSGQSGPQAPPVPPPIMPPFQQ